MTALPRTSGTPYEAGTVIAIAAQTAYGKPVVEITFGNVFSSTVCPVTLQAARDLRAALDHAISLAEARGRQA